MLVPAPPFPRLEWIKDERVVYMGSTWPNGPQSHGYPNSRWIQKSGSLPSQSHSRLLSKRSQPIPFSFVARSFGEMVMCQLSGQFLTTPLQVGKSLPTSLLLPRFLKSESFPRASTGVLRCSTETEVSESRNRMFILGMGFVGQFFAQDLKNHGW